MLSLFHKNLHYCTMQVSYILYDFTNPYFNEFANKDLCLETHAVMKCVSLIKQRCVIKKTCGLSKENVTCLWYVCNQKKKSTTKVILNFRITIIPIAIWTYIVIYSLYMWENAHSKLVLQDVIQGAMLLVDWLTGSHSWDRDQPTVNILR